MDNRDTTPVTQAELDAYGFNPDNYDWLPVPRQRRADGWSPATQRRFIEVLADTGSVTEASNAVNMSKQSCYRLRRSPGAEGFAAAWDAAIAEASRRLVDIAFERAINGVPVPVLDISGNQVFTRRRYNDRLLMFLLRAHHPERYRHADRTTRDPDEPAPPAAAPVSTAIAALEPPCPADPHRLMPPQELRVMLELEAANAIEEAKFQTMLAEQQAEKALAIAAAAEEPPRLSRSARRRLRRKENASLASPS